MKKLVQGIHHFQKIGFKQQKELFERLQEGQAPEACLITCSDSRIDPNLLTNSEPGRIFIVRNVGNVIPCFGTTNNGEMAAVEFAVMELGVKDIIVCGHTGCGAMRALLNPENFKRIPSVLSWLRHAASTREIIQEHYQHLTGDELYNVAAEENVLVQMEHLRTLPAIAARVSSGRVNLHGWMYKIATGEVFHYDVEEGQFVHFSSGLSSVILDSRLGQT